ncbi:5-(carboxyamino)imidazole ribonucleotide synthase [Fuchsiella alkaliacetigena]|uniref:5-(carboxyamino)imidazole ribonucleotide synthase n=1 Tax=Fuchsiella alkaliacetigena TaxID=957042 RepID=UPI00200A95B8|nr:5-(carboxyamino)imidazole ribonucleotide synthase [Fuchsiella alkaliacetigena]MCK8825699.1 5-(carboxyamino)imidazole ribonucleotide synthase [Fuchsiella alkaliacetigena]
MLDPTKQNIGIIGGGQLGKMMILEAKKMNFQVNILDPTPDCPAHSIADEHLVASFTDQEAIKELAVKSDILTYEFEHIDVEALKELEKEGYQVYPTVKSLAAIQDKFRQKSILKDEGLPVPDFLKAENRAEIKEAAERFSYPLMLKSCTGGYDGKGNAVINNKAEIDKAFRELKGAKNDLMVEEFIPFKKEISVIIARGIDGDKKVYPVGENEHQNNILFTTKVPAQITDEVADKAVKLAFEVIDVFKGVGIFCIEMFVTAADKLLINEIAPRPHNSGHYSIEGCITSQFEQHIRAISGLPLGETELLKPVVMRNILGEEKEGEAVVKGVNEALAIPGVKAHIYGKRVNRPERKMGHLTVTADTVVEAHELVLEASGLIEITGE